MRARKFSLIGSAVLLGACSWLASAQNAGAPAKNPAIANVGPLSITRGEFEQRAAASLAEYRSRSGGQVPDEFVPIVRRQVLEGMIRVDLLVLEAQRRNLMGSVAEAETQMAKDPFFNPGGKFDAAKFNAVKAANSPAWQSAIQELRRRIGAQKLNESLASEHGPSAEAVQSSAQRALTHGAFDYLALRAREFDGSYPEPREAEVTEYLRSHEKEFAMPDRATLSVVFVDKPAPSPTEAADPALLKAWEGRRRQTADSALAAIRAGGSFDSVAAHMGGAHPNVVVTAGNFPAYWRGTPEQSAAILRVPAGTVFPEVVAGRPGFVLARVEASHPAHVASTLEAARAIRQKLRANARDFREDRELRPLYAAMGDSLRGPAIRVRYAVADTAAVRPGEPTDSDLDRYYRGHLADYSRFDATTSSIVQTPLSAVRDEVRTRWIRDRKVELARGIVEGLQRTWSQGRRDDALEKSAALLREVGPVPLGAPVDTGAAASAVTDSLFDRGGAKGVGVAPFARGVAVYQVFERIENFRPTFEQAKPQLRRRDSARRDRADEAGARALFERDPSAFTEGKVVHFSRIVVEPLPALQVPLTRGEVERYRRLHFDRYSVPEVVGARHILISPTGPGVAADREARARADSLYQVLKAGADFATIAQRYSDDPATKPKGGDLGEFGRGAMLDEFERVAFTLQPGDLSTPVKTEVGYHIIKCTSHLPAYADPLKWTYPTVGLDAALEKADSLAARRADSLYRSIRTPQQAIAAAQRLGLEVVHNSRTVGEETLVPNLVAYFNELDRMKPGQLYPGTVKLKGAGSVITWVDSIAPAKRPTWEDARAQALEQYRIDGPTRAMLAKRAELDSMMAAGWSLDSLATLWGGLTHAPDVSPASGVSDLGGGKEIVDSLLFGAKGGRGLAENQTSGWLRFPVGYVRMRLDERLDPNPGQLAARIENDRRAELERRLRGFFEDLKDRYPVRILDPALRDVNLPPPPTAGSH